MFGALVEDGDEGLVLAPTAHLLHKDGECVDLRCEVVDVWVINGLPVVLWRGSWLITLRVAGNGVDCFELAHKCASVLFQCVGVHHQLRSVSNQCVQLADLTER